MGKHFLDYKKGQKRLVIKLENDWTMEELRNYQQDLTAFVEGFEVKTVLIDQQKAGFFPPESIEIFEANTHIPQLKNAVVACVIAPAEIKNTDESITAPAEGPKIFLSVEAANDYLNDVK